MEKDRFDYREADPGRDEAKKNSPSCSRGKCVYKHRNTAEH